MFSLTLEAKLHCFPGTEVKGTLLWGITSRTTDVTTETVFLNNLLVVAIYPDPFLAQVWIHGVLGPRPGPKEYNPRHLGSHGTAILGLTGQPPGEDPWILLLPSTSLHPSFHTRALQSPWEHPHHWTEPLNSFSAPSCQSLRHSCHYTGSRSATSLKGTEVTQGATALGTKQHVIQQTCEPPRPSTPHRAQPSGGSSGSEILQHTRHTHWPGKKVCAYTHTPSVCTSVIPHKL